MSNDLDPKWLNVLSRKLSWAAIPNLAMVFVGLQMVGFFLTSTDPEWIEKLALIPEYVLRGEIWRVLTFLALPVSQGIIGLLFGLMFGYFILNSIEEEWGATKTTIYVLSSIIITTLFSLVFGYPVLSVTGFVSTWFLAAATLFPEQTIQIYFILPVKMKWLGLVAATFVLLEFARGEWIDRFYLIAIYINYLAFFGPSLVYRAQQWQRRREFRNNWRK